MHRENVNFFYCVFLFSIHFKQLPMLSYSNYRPTQWISDFAAAFILTYLFLQLCWCCCTLRKRQLSPTYLHETTYCWEIRNTRFYEILLIKRSLWMAGHFTTSYMYVGWVFTSDEVRVAVSNIRVLIIQCKLDCLSWKHRERTNQSQGPNQALWLVYSFTSVSDNAVFN